MSDDDNLFARWSRRKRRVAEEAEAVPPAPEAAVVEIAEPETPEEEAELLARLELPVPETLTAGDDFTAFMKAGVPEFLKKRALRVLWRSNPVLANLDGLNDYDDDFTSPELNQKVLATAYKVGRGFLRDEPNPEIMQSNDDRMQNDEVDPAELEAELPELEGVPDVAESDRGAIPDDMHEGDDLSFNPKRMKFTT